jgi:hypothetical protein
MLPDADPQRLSRFIIASMEGAMLLSRVTRELCVLEGIASDLKRFVALHLTETGAAGERGATLGNAAEPNILS